MTILEDIEKRVRPTMCDTGKVEDGRLVVTYEGRITDADFTALVNMARDGGDAGEPVEIVPAVPAVVLRQFRDFVIREATQWTVHGSHHNPIWQRVAEALDAVTMNTGQICRLCDRLDLNHGFSYTDLCPDCAVALACQIEVEGSAPVLIDRHPDEFEIGRPVHSPALIDPPRCKSCGETVPWGADHRCQGIRPRDPFPATAARRTAGECTYPDCPCLEEIGHCGNDVTPIDDRSQSTLATATPCPVIARYTDGEPKPDDGRRCRVCGCTTEDCRQCIAATGIACHWVEDDLCSACVMGAPVRGEAGGGDIATCWTDEDAMTAPVMISEALPDYPCAYPECECDDGTGPCRHMMEAGHNNFPRK
jgi:hypothetical protein